MNTVINRSCIFLLCSTVAFGQKQISVEDFNSQDVFREHKVSEINWTQNERTYMSLVENSIIRFDPTTGQPLETIFDGNANRLTVDAYQMSGDGSRLLIQTATDKIYRRSFRAEYFVYDITGKKLQRLSSNGKQSYATCSPDGSKVAFVRDNDLYVVTLPGFSEARITADGAVNRIINGSCDWVYEEEFGFVKAFYWSPDSRHIAYYRFDEVNVKTYAIQKWNNQLYPELYSFKYPKAGEANSTIEIWITDASGTNKVKGDLKGGTDFYIPRVMWTKDPQILSVSKMNRLQNQLEILHVNISDGASTPVLTDQSSTYVDVEYCDDLVYLEDKQHFIYSSEKSGYKHLYLNAMDGSPTRQITQGDWEVTNLLGVDEKRGLVYFESTEGDYLGRQFYVAGLDGEGKTRLSVDEGTHTITISPSCRYYLDEFTTASQPTTVQLYDLHGNKPVKMLEENLKLRKTIEEYGIVSKTFFKYQSGDGTSLDGYWLKPRDFDPSRKYPVVVYQYSGPRSPNVLNKYGGSHFYYHQMLVQRGYLVAVMDTRGTGYRGEHFTKMTYKQMGRLEVEDLVAAAMYLSGLSYVDPTRLAIWGWSYGGYTTSLVMTKAAGAFKVGIAVSPVTNWRFYDTIYTERYLQRPQDNPSGYDDNSPTTYAADLKGSFLLIHGTGDDNVHFQNSVVLEAALVNAGKQFHSFFYPDKNHGMNPGYKSKEHLYQMMFNFIENNL